MYILAQIEPKHRVILYKSPGPIPVIPESGVFRFMG